MISLDSLAEVGPRTPRPDLPGDAPIAVVPLSAVDAVRGELSALRQEPFGSALARGLRPIREGDVLLAGISPALETGKVAIARDLPGGRALATSELIVVRPTAVEPEWLRAFLRSGHVRELLRSTGTGVGGRRRVASETVARLQLPERTATERHETLDRLRRIEDAAAARQRLRATIAELTRSVASQVLGRRQSLTTLLAWHGTPESANRGGGVRLERGAVVLQERHVVDGVIDERIPANTRRPARAVALQPGDLLVVTRAVSAARLGVTALYEGKPVAACAGASLTRVELDDGLDEGWLWAWLNGTDARRQVLDVCVRRANTVSLSPDALRELQAPVPSRREQERIGSMARRVRRAIALARKQSDQLASLQEALLREAFGPVSLAPLAARATPKAPPTLVLSTSESMLWKHVSADQRRVWSGIRESPTPMPLDALAPSPAMREQTRRTLKLLEAAGVVVQDVGQDVPSWRTLDEDSELLNRP